MVSPMVLSFSPCLFCCEMSEPGHNIHQNFSKTENNIVFPAYILLVNLLFRGKSVCPPLAIVLNLCLDWSQPHSDFVLHPNDLSSSLVYIYVVDHSSLNVEFSTCPFQLHFKFQPLSGLRVL